MSRRVHLIAAARPNFMKVAPLWHALSAAEGFTPVMIHTGQHYDPAMSDAIFADLDLPAPDHHLGIGSGSHAEQTGRVMMAYEALAKADRPDWLVVVGDVNSTAAAAMAAAKLAIPIVHLEAGLRSGDRDMPEEINRLVTDAITDVFWTPSRDADANLAAEGVPSDRITMVGNIMLDSLERIRPKIGAAAEGDDYGLVTLHRPSNVDEAERLAAIVEALVAAQAKLPLVFSVHPRTIGRLRHQGLLTRLEQAGTRILPPIPYLEFMRLLFGARAAITDSGGIQEETTYLGIPCLTLRANTERPITISAGTNRLVEPEGLNQALDDVLGTDATKHPRPEGWDGKVAGRCVEDLRRRDASRRR